VLRACAKHDVVVEINAHPWRLDLDWRWHQTALEFGCMMSINPDAHSIPELDHMHWGVEMTRNGRRAGGSSVERDDAAGDHALPPPKRRSLARVA
jgi:DNA polymerase (family 10)